jgi:hypothetical protein
LPLDRELTDENLILEPGRDFETLSPSEQSRVTRIYEYLLDFPLTVKSNGSAEHLAERSTRLGNIIAGYEAYADSRYGIDGTYFWHHLLNFASDASRKAFEDAYSFAESLVLASFAGAIVAILHFIALLGFAVGEFDESLVFIRVVSGPLISSVFAVFGLVVWFGFYRASFPAHREAGASLRAIIDVGHPTFVEWAKSVQVPAPDDTIKQVEVLNEYLKALALPSTPPNRQLHPTAAVRRGRPRVSRGR